MRLARTLARTATGIALMLLLSSDDAHAQSQNYGLFRVDLGFGVARAGGTQSTGASASLESMFNILDRLSLGLLACYLRAGPSGVAIGRSGNT